ncbi:MAG: tetratricopeptide repeat protein [Bryobacterales bacterium]|nr:tetratricopeptide repeat protein [Bryobacterales bacterium]
MQKDINGLPLSGATAPAVEHYEAAVAELQCYRGDPVARAEAALTESPDFVMAHVVRAWLHLFGTEPSGLLVARESLNAAWDLPANTRERGHLEAIRHLTEGRWHAAGRVMEDVTIEFPHDALGLLAGHQIDFFTGHSRMLLNRIARALPRWHASMPGYHSLLGMHAFGLEETGDYYRAEAAGRLAVELKPTDGWALHAVAHVFEMQNRTSDGIAWMRGNDGWTGDSFLQVHNWWHLALYHLEAGDIPATLSLFDENIYSKKSNIVMEMVDASSLLWRLYLRGADTGDRWKALADNWAPVSTAGNYAFNDLHAMMAFIGSGRHDSARAVIAAQKEAMSRADDNASFTTDIGQPACQAFLAFGDGDYAKTVELLRPIRSIAARFGGSHAQRDVIDLTLLEAALRTGDAALSAALASERDERRHDSPLTQLFLRRAMALQSTPQTEMHHDAKLPSQYAAKFR